MTMRPRWPAAVAFALALALGACGGGGAGNDPAAAVTTAYNAVSTGGVSKISDYVCAAKKNDLAGIFGAGNIQQITAAGVEPTTLFDAMKVSFTNLVVTQTAKTDTTATVTVTGDSTITFDKDKFRAIMKAILVNKGQPSDDATIDRAMALMTPQLTQTQKVNQTVQLVNEGGKWLMCG